MTEHKPAQLPEVDGLEITHYGIEIVPGDEGAEPQRVPKDTVVLASESTARRLAKLWRNLPNGCQAKCWAPAFRLRFFQKQAVLVDAEVCWYCSTIRIANDTGWYAIGFDPSVPVAQKLLQLLQEIIVEQPALSPENGSATD